MEEKLETPVLFCVFNRPELTARVFEVIRAHKPKTLFIASDGPRKLVPADDAKIEEVRRIVANVDWDCQVEQRFLPRNVGCKLAVASAINWAFTYSEQLIILEDDCLPNPSFFGYCETLLDRYRDNEQIMMVSGNNFQDGRRSDASYYFSRLPHIWGWATWKRAWQHFDVDLSSWPQFKRDKKLRSIFKDADEYDHWSRTLDLQHAGGIDTWDFPWAYAVWSNNGLSILPEKNLVTNIGFGAGAAHTKDPKSKLAGIPARSIGRLLHPLRIEVNEKADRHTWRSVFKPSIYNTQPRQPYWKKLNLFRRGKKQNRTDVA
jgi:hypothetical protein